MNNGEFPSVNQEYKFLVEHFRNLANQKDSVIIHYRELLERLKPYIDIERELRREIYDYSFEIDKLRKEVELLKKKTKTSK